MENNLQARNMAYKANAVKEFELSPVYADELSHLRQENEAMKDIIRGLKLEPIVKVDRELLKNESVIGLHDAYNDIIQRFQKFL